MTLRQQPLERGRGEGGAMAEGRGRGRAETEQFWSKEKGLVDRMDNSKVYLERTEYMK